MIWVVIVIMLLLMISLAIVLFVTVRFVNRELVYKDDFEKYQAAVRGTLEALSLETERNKSQTDTLLDATDHDLHQLDSKIEYNRIKLENKITAMKRSLKNNEQV